MQKMEQLPMIVIQHPIAARPEEAVRTDVASHYDEVVEALLDG